MSAAGNPGEDAVRRRADLPLIPEVSRPVDEEEDRKEMRIVRKQLAELAPSAENAGR